MSTLTDSNPTALDLLYKSVITQRRMTELCIKHKKEVGKELRCGCDCAESPPPQCHILHYRFRESATNCSIIQSVPERRPRGKAGYEEAARHLVLLTASAESVAASQPVRSCFQIKSLLVLQIC